MEMSILGILILIFSVQSPVNAEQTRAHLSAQVDRLLKHARFADSFWGISIYAPLRGEWLYRRNAEKNFKPASNLKILTTVAAFEYLGSDYRFQTELSYSGNLSDGVLEGDLYVRGGGDPSFSGQYDANPVSTETLLAELVAQLHASGLRAVRGNLIADLSFFDTVALPESWEWGDLGLSYGTPVSPLSLNDGQFVLALATDAKGTLRWSTRPSATSDVALRFENPGSGKLRVLRVPGGNHLKVSGSLPACSDLFQYYSSWDPSRQFLEALRMSLENEEIAVQGQLLCSDQDKTARQGLLLHQSEPLWLLARVLLRESQNHYADCFLKTIGAEREGLGSFESGAKGVRQLLASSSLLQASPHGLLMRDGSGLSAQNNCTPLQLVAALDHALSAPYSTAWIGSLPRLGYEGTLRARGGSSAAVGRVWAKTGSINRVRCLSGYVESLEGEPLIFSLMVNGYSCTGAEVTDVMDEICALLVNLPAKQQSPKTDPRWGLLSKAWATFNPGK